MKTLSKTELKKVNGGFVEEAGRFAGKANRFLNNALRGRIFFPR
ncbi:bacteriocin [Staphylococcus auricularis]|uniref:Bacteriocin n=1 Tax=Staphylococcus auricularis TaxID=29379 RepID=A0ABX5IGC3_9STAP|nr:bacteriocin [Staphylococcus auricularis]MCE5038954.1 bacteriocin [Staphylococcus auricularis]MEB6570756.1 bacteriocin [Staphylococcus auricularis]PTH18527.1 hypothetical protein BU607_04660 [Staphylococcus auricularis]PTH25476.1 hypothetical protein BU608_07460 [Staphylococcus auricularis]